MFFIEVRKDYLQEMRNINLIHGDCLEKMKDIEDKSIDMILCDLPYGSTKCKWDSQINLSILWEQYKRIIKDNGIIALFAQTPFDKILGCSNLEMLKYEWIWDKGKPTGHLNAKYAPMKKHENILIFTNNPTSYTKKNKNNRYYIDFLLNKTDKTINRTFKKECVYDKNSNKTTVQTKTGHPVDIIKFNRVSKPIHPTQKPVDLLEYLIKIYTKQNDVVLDNCMGSGSTGEAVLRVGGNRKFIGIEKDNTYFNIAKERIENTYNELNISFKQ